MYYPYPEFWHNIEQRLRTLEESNERLDKENQQLKEQLNQIKPIHIENINYKIQELVVRELSGSLNIGMTGLSDPQEINKILNDDENGSVNEISLQDIEQGKMKPDLED